jgi:hypothetical protein
MMSPQKRTTSLSRFRLGARAPASIMTARAGKSRSSQILILIPSNQSLLFLDHCIMYLHPRSCM